MSEFASSVLIDRPLHEVWKFISDPPNASHWGRGVADVVQTSEPPLRVGTTLKFRMSSQPMEGRIVAYIPDNMFAMEFTAGPVAGSVVSYVLEPVDGKTRLTREFVMRASGRWKLIEPLLHYREVRGRRTGLQNIKRIVERLPAAAAK